jgi:hypothetical protein
MGYDLVIKNKQGEDMHQDGQSYNWARVGLQNPLLVKMFGGHTSETVVRMCINCFQHNPNYEAYVATYGSERKLVTILDAVMKKQYWNDIASIIESYDDTEPITNIIDGYGKARIALATEDLTLYREYRHIHDVQRFFNLAINNPDCYWDVDYESATWNGIQPVSFYTFSLQ